MLLSRALDRVEDLYLKSIRVFLGAVVLLVTLAMLGSLYWALYKTIWSSEVEVEDHFVAPTWTQMRTEFLPVSASQTDLDSDSETQDTESSGAGAADDERLELVRDILSSLDRQYNLKDREEETFSSYYTPRAIHEWLTVRRGIPDELIDELLEAMESFADELGHDQRVAQINSESARRKLMISAIEEFVTAYLTTYKSAEGEVKALNAKTMVESAANRTLALIIAGGSLGMLLCIVLMVILLRIEMHLREIATLRISSNRD